MNTYATFILKEPNVTKHMSYLHDKYVVVFKDKVQNNISVCVKSMLPWKLKQCFTMKK